MSDILLTREEKEKQLAALRMMLTMLVVINKIEDPMIPTLQYKNSRDYRENCVFIEKQAKLLGLVIPNVEDDLRILIAKYIGKPFMMIPNREVNLINPKGTA